MMSKKIPYYRYDRYTGDGVTSFQCMHCFSFFSMAFSDFYYCPICGVKFQGSLIRHRYYTFDVTYKKQVSRWDVEHAITWFREEEDGLNWSDVGCHAHFLTPGAALKAKIGFEEEERRSCEKFEKLSGKKHPIDRVYRVNRIKTERDFWDKNIVKVSDINFYKKTGKLITDFLPEDAHFCFEK